VRNKLVDVPITYEVHPFTPYIPDDSTCLIVGTIPPHRFCEDSCTKKKFGKLQDGDDIDWFYGSKDNALWNYLDEKAKTKLERMAWADNCKIGFFDLYYKVIRYKKLATDSNIVPIQFRDIFACIEQYQSIEKILCTSQLVFRLLADMYLLKYNKYRNGNKLTIGNREVEMVVMPSPSSLNRETEQNKANKWQQILCLGKDYDQNTSPINS
jgi:G:T/U-mismatch repair DNA glycosylase